MTPASWAPNYRALLESGELDRRVAELDQLLVNCRVCPRCCGVNRRAGETKFCGAGYAPLLASFAPHFGEEPPLSGAHLPLGEVRGSGAIFLGRCNLRCVFCQNAQISQDQSGRFTREVSCEQLAEIALELQGRGCHNVNFVSPTHFAPQVARAAALAARRGLGVPLVYNTNAYDSLAALRLLEGVFDIYLPDLKYADDAAALECSGVQRYVAHARAAIVEMFRQVGEELVLDERGLLRRGLVIRLLALPNNLAGLRETLRWIREALSPRVTLSVMSQYYPANQAGGGRFPLLDRPLLPREYDDVLGWLDEFGFENCWIQPQPAGAARYYRPDFRNRDEPFADAKDFR